MGELEGGVSRDGHIGATKAAGCSGEGERASIDGGAAGVGVGTREGERAAAAVLREHAGAGDDARERLVVCAGVGECRVIGDVSRVSAATEAAGGGDFECAGVDRGAAAVGVVAGEGECASAKFGEGAGPAAGACRIGNDIGDGEVAAAGVGGVEAENRAGVHAVRGVTAGSKVREQGGDVAGREFAGPADIEGERGAITRADVRSRPTRRGAVVEGCGFGKLQRADADRRRAGVGVVTGERHRAAALLGQAAASTRNNACKGGRGAVADKHRLRRAQCN